MASKVNTKFVIILSLGLIVMGAGVGGAFYMLKLRSGDHYISLGDKAMAEGKFEAADKWYERAVGKEQFNVAWLQKWKSAREKIVPETQNAYFAAYRMYHGILRNLAQAQKTNIQAHCDHLDMIYQECAFGGSRGAWEFLATTSDEAMSFFETDPENPTPPQIRRFRGLALTELWLGDSNYPKDRVELARKDLEAALRADPKDSWVAIALSVWHRRAAAGARLVGEDEQADSHDQQARQVVVDFSAANPSDPVGMMGVITADLFDIERSADPMMSAGENQRRQAERAQALQPRIEPLVIAAKASPNLSSQAVNQIVSLAMRLDPEKGHALATDYINGLLEKDPENVDYMLISAQLLAQSDKVDLNSLIAAYQKIVDLKDRPVSLEGIRLLTVRNRARFAQASASLQAVSQAKSDEERKQLIESARSYRNELARYLPEQAPDLLFIDGKAALLDTTPDVPRARALLAQFLKSPGDAAPPVILEASLLMAEVGMRSNPPEPGLAREHLIRVLAARPNSVEVRSMLAQVERALQNFEAALVHLRAIIDIDPGNEAAQNDLRMLTALTASGSETKVDDPVLQVLIDAERLSRGSGTSLGDDQAALELLERNLETHKHDPRLVLAVVNAKYSKGDLAGARQALRTGLANNPDESRAGVANLKEIERRLSAADTLEGSIAFINESNLPEFDRQTLLYATYTQFKKPDEAAAALNQAEKLNPDHPRIVEIRFQSALQSTPPNFERAAELTAKAAKLNLDQAEGDTFRARLQIAQKNLREAAATLTRAVDRGNATAGVYRLLGLVHAELGRTQDAMASFRRAIDLVPTDLLTIKTYLSVLVKAGEQAEALAVARKSQNVGRTDPEFLNVWFALEARAGKTDFARDRREEMFRRDPDDVENGAALAEIYIEQKAWERARQLIDQLRAKNDNLRLAAIDARWHADRGDLRAANSVFRNHIGTITEPQNKLAAYMTFGQFLLQRGSQKEGIAALRQAAQYQDPATMEVDLMLGDIQISRGLFEDAEASYRRVVDAKVPDDDLRIRKRLIEALNQQQKYADAEAAIAQLGQAAESDVEVLAQRSSAARGMGKLALAREYLDKAIAKFPDEPMPYLRRARLIAMESSLMNDAMADLATAIRLRPGFWQALRTRAMYHLAEGRTDEGMRDLKEAVERNPGLDELRMEYVDYLLRFGMENEAVDTADAAMALRPNDVRLAGQFGAYFGRSGRWSRSARYYKIIWEQLRDEPSAIAYCNALLGATPPALNEADAVLASSELKIDSSWRLLLVRAILRKKQGKESLVRNDLVASFDLLGADGTSILNWCENLRNLYPAAPDRLNILNSVRVPAQVEEWVIFARTRITLEDPTQQDAAITALRALRDKAMDNTLRGNIQMDLASALARQSKWSECLDEIRLGLQFRPNDPVLSNNAAAILSDSMGKPREALPFAERAHAADPTNFDFADTLATTYWALGDKAQALRKMGDALRLATSEADKAGSALKIARWRHESGDTTGAQSMLDLVREMAADSPALKDLIKSDLERLLTDMNAK